MYEFMASLSQRLFYWEELTDEANILCHFGITRQFVL
jgi:hypothetical protein